MKLGIAYNLFDGEELLEGLYKIHKRKCRIHYSDISKYLKLWSQVPIKFIGDCM